MILKLDDALDDFRNFVHACIINPKEFQDISYLGNIYRVRIKHVKRVKPALGTKYPHPNRKRIPRTNIEVSICFTCGGPAVGPVCMLKGCDVVIPPPTK